MCYNLINICQFSQEFIECCPSKPTNSEVASQCQCELTPVELSQILFGMYMYIYYAVYTPHVWAHYYFFNKHIYTCTEPAILDFGSIIVDSLVEKTITIKNFSKKHCSIHLKVRNCLTSYALPASPKHMLYPASRG